MRLAAGGIGGERKAGPGRGWETGPGHREWASVAGVGLGEAEEGSGGCGRPGPGPAEGGRGLCLGVSRAAPLLGAPPGPL